MKRRTFIESCAGGALILTGSRPDEARAASGGALEDAFRQPPPSAFAKTWWHWMNGNISEAGITRDLEAMKRAGCGGFQIFQVGTGIPKGPVDYGSPEHLRLLRHAATEANRLGLEFAMHNCPGWSSTGGPWITPELSMQVVAWSETPVSGGGKVNVTLPRPEARLNYYRDAMVLAFPAQPGEARPMRELIRNARTNSGPAAPELFTDGKSETAVEIRPAGERQSAWLDLEFAEPFEARSIALSSALLPVEGQGRPGFSRPVITLHASENGSDYRRVCEVPGGGVARVGSGVAYVAPLVANFLPVQAKFFRLESTQAYRILNLRLSGAPRLRAFSAKASFPGTRKPGPADGDSVNVEGPSIDPASVLDLTSSMNAEGKLEWDAPAGNWTVLRIGHTVVGVQNHPAPDGGGGLECDKFSREAYDFHFQHFFGQLFDVLEPLAAKGLAAALIDSYETGLQNWTAKLPDEFRARRGYDLKPYMPAMLGWVVGSPAVSDRFLWDMRKTHAELMDDYYYGRFKEDLHRHGMRCFIEPYDPGNFDEMPAGRHADMVMGEFWLGQANHHSVKLTASIGHIYGTKVIGAESFTGQSKWQEHPYCMKTVGDFMYTQGLNNYVFHRFAHQPHPDAAPGMTMGPWGWHFDRTNTWFEKSTAWLKYVARAQNLLRQGVFVGDLLYFTGEDSPQVAPALEQLKPAVPAGYDWDTIDAGAILTLVRVENGAIVLPDGAAYRALVLRESYSFSLDLLRKIRDLVNAGMTLVVNSRPRHIPGLANYPSSDDELRRMVAELWGDLDGQSSTARTFGKGRVFWGRPLADVLQGQGVPPDFEFTARSADAPVHWIHRRDGDADIYFVARRFVSYGSSPGFAIYPPAGEKLYGSNHAACGLVVGRNGAAVFERSGEMAPVASVRKPIAGWTHIAVVYRDGEPSLFIDGRRAGDARKSGRVVHPGLGESQGAPLLFHGADERASALP